MSTKHSEKQVTYDVRRFREEKMAEQNDPSLRHGASRGARFLGGNTSPRVEVMRRDEVDANESLPRLGS